MKGHSSKRKRSNQQVISGESRPQKRGRPPSRKALELIAQTVESLSEESDDQSENSEKSDTFEEETGKAQDKVESTPIVVRARFSNPTLKIPSNTSSQTVESTPKVIQEKVSDENPTTPLKSVSKKDSKKSSSRKQVGRAKGAKKWTEGDIESLLNCCEEVFGDHGDDWDKIHEIFKKAGSKWGRPERTASALRTKFHDLVQGESTGGGERNQYEKKALMLEGEIVNRVGATVAGEDAKGEEQAKATSTRRANTRFEFEKNIAKQFERSEKNQERRHEENKEFLKRDQELLGSMVQLLQSLVHQPSYPSIPFNIDEE